MTTAAVARRARGRCRRSRRPRPRTSRRSSHRAPRPRPTTSPPTTNDGSQPGAVEAEGEQRRRGGLAVGAGDGDGAAVAADGGQHVGPAQHRRCPRPGPPRTSGLSAGTAVETADRRRPRGRRWAASWPTWTVDAEAGAGGRGPATACRSLPDTWWPMAGQHRGDGAHAGAPDADDVDAPGRRQVDAGVAPRLSHGRRAASTRAATPSAASRRPTPGAAARHGRRAGRRVGQQGARPRRTRRSASSSASGTSTRRRRRRPGPGRWPSGGRRGRRAAARGPTAADDGQLGHGVAAGPADRTSAAASEQVHAVLVLDRLVDQPVRRRAASARGRRRGPSPGAPTTWRTARSAAVGPALDQRRSTALLIRGAPERPPMTRRPRVGRSGRPRAARAAARPAAPVDGEDLGAHRVAGDDGPGQVGAGEGHGGRRGEAAPAAGSPRPARRSARRRRAGTPAAAPRPAPHGERRRSRRRGPRPPAGAGATSAMARARARLRPHGRADVVGRAEPSAGMPRPGRTVSGEAGGGHQLGLEPPLAADEVDRRAGVARGDQGPGDGEAGHEVAGGAAAGDDRPGAASIGAPARGRAGRSGRRRLAGDVEQDAEAAMVTTSEEPPKETNGSGTPVTGSMPMTAPMLMTACPTIHAVMPAASSSRSGRGPAARSGRRARRGARTGRRRARVPTRPSSSPMMAKMKSVWALGRKPHLARLAPRPTPASVPGAEGDERLGHLVAGVGESANGSRKDDTRSRR